MKPTFLTLLLVCITLSFPPRFSIAADSPRYVAVATYINTAEMNKTVGNRAHAILRAQKIESGAAGSLGMTISVPTDRAAEALQLLAKAIKAEELKLTLIGPKGGIITPDEVLQPTIATANGGDSRIDPALLAAQKSLPKDITTKQFIGALESGLWNSKRTAVAISIAQPKASVVFVFLRQSDGAYLAVDASRVEGGNFGKLGRPRSYYQRFETVPVEWVDTARQVGLRDGELMVEMRTRAWRGGQRYTASEPLLIRADGTISWR